jgi:Ca2+-binding RTX toxin-like protein
MPDRPCPPRRSVRRAVRLGAPVLAGVLVVGLLPGVAGATLTTNEYAAPALTVVSDGADGIAVTCGGVGGDDLLVNGASPTTGSGVDACTTVSTITLTGGPGANTITVDATSGVGMSALATVTASGGGGDDTLELTGGTIATVTINGDAGLDTLEVVGAITTLTLNGGGDDDTFNIVDGTASAQVDGGLGVDTLSYATRTAAVTATVGGVAPGLNSQAGIENLVGSPQGDTLTGDGGPNAISGGLGTDTISGAAGNDTIDGGLGADQLNGDADADDISFGLGDNVTGGTGDDTLHPYPGESADSLDAGLGTDVLDYTGFATAVTVDLSVPTATGVTVLAAGVEDVVGGAGNDTLTGGSVPNELSGGDGADTIAFGLDDVVAGGNGNDVLRPTPDEAAVSIDGGSGTNGLDYSAFDAAHPVAVDLSVPSATGVAGAVTAIQDVTGGAGADTITGSVGANTLVGGAGADTISGGSGNDDITFGLGDVVTGGPNDDTLHPTAGQSAASLDAGTGTDVLDYTGFVAAVTVDLGAPTATGVTALTAGVEDVVGGSGADTLTGGTGPNELSGGDGADTIAFGEDDVVVGGNGDDVFRPTPDEDAASVDGEAGTNRLDYSTYDLAHPVSVDLSLQSATGVAGAVVGIQNVTGGAGADSIAGSSAANTLLGGAGDDQLIGGDGGADTLTGGADDDTAVVFGSASVDTITVAATSVVVGGVTTAVSAETVSVQAFDGADTVTVTPSATVGFFLVGGPQSDTLNYNSSGLTGVTNVDPTISATGVEDVDYALFESLTFGEPVNTVLPAITGTATVPQTLTASNGTWTGATPFSYAHQWVRCNAAGASCVDIAGQTGTSYVLAAADIGGTIRVRVTADNPAPTGASATSAQTAVVAAVPGTPNAPGVSSGQAGELLVSWTAPAANSSAVTGYVVRINGGTPTSVAGTSTTLTGLVPGQSYSITVAAVNAVGTGASSAPTSGVAGAAVPATPAAPAIVTGATGSVVITWVAPADGGSAITGYEIRVNGGAAINRAAGSTSLTIGGLTPGSTVSVTVAAKNAVGTSAQSAAGTGRAGASVGYWMLERNGFIYRFGAAADFTGPTLAAGVTAVDAESTPSGNGLLVLASNGSLYAYGDAPFFGGVDTATLNAGERVSSISVTPSGGGYWVFTNRGRVVAFGNAPFLGDLTSFTLNGPVLDAVPTPSGLGYYMVGSDGGVFSFGDAVFYGSMGGAHLNKPVAGLVPDPDGVGYWLVATDGGVFAFDAGFRGSMGGTTLNAPVNGMIAYGNGYLMVASDGGVFNFATDLAFQGSLGATPPANPIVAITALG